MKNSAKELFDRMISKHAFLSSCEESMLAGIQLLIECFAQKGKLLVCGNGGSAADAEHIVGELAKGFIKKRKADDHMASKLRAFGSDGESLIAHLQQGLFAMSLCSQTSLITAIMNDIGQEEIFAQQVLTYGALGDILLGISTSGNSENVLKAGLVAKAVGMETILLTGQNVDKAISYFDVTIDVPSEVTWEIQDMHSTVYHIICAVIEEDFWAR